MWYSGPDSNIKDVSWEGRIILPQKCCVIEDSLASWNAKLYFNLCIFIFGMMGT